MKLYTEEQVLKIIQKSVMDKPKTYYEILKYYTPIQLPSDEELFKQAIKQMEEWYGSDCKSEIDAHFRGAKWMREQIKEQADENIQSRSK